MGILTESIYLHCESLCCAVVAATELCKNQFDSDWKLGKEELLEVISTRDGGRAGERSPVNPRNGQNPAHFVQSEDRWMVGSSCPRPGVGFFRGRWKNAAERVMNAYARCCVHLGCIRFHVSPLTWDAPQKKPGAVHDEEKAEITLRERWSIMNDLSAAW